MYNFRLLLLAVFVVVFSHWASSGEPGKINFKFSKGDYTPVIEGLIVDDSIAAPDYAAGDINDFDTSIGYRNDGFLWDFKVGYRRGHSGYIQGESVDADLLKIDFEMSVAMFDFPDYSVTLTPTVMLVSRTIDADCDDCVGVDEHPDSAASVPYMTKGIDGDGYFFAAGLQTDYDYDMGPIGGRLNVDIAYGLVGTGNFTQLIVENEFILLDKGTHSLSLGIGYRYSRFDASYDELLSGDSMNSRIEDDGAFAAITFTF